MRYDIHTTCPICGQAISWINSRTTYEKNKGVVIVKTKGKTTHLYHEVCIDQERKHNKRGSENG